MQNGRREAPVPLGSVWARTRADRIYRHGPIAAEVAPARWPRRSSTAPAANWRPSPRPRAWRRDSGRASRCRCPARAAPSGPLQRIRPCRRRDAADGLRPVARVPHRGGPGRDPLGGRCHPAARPAGARLSLHQHQHRRRLVAQAPRRRRHRYPHRDVPRRHGRRRRPRLPRLDRPAACARLQGRRMGPTPGCAERAATAASWRCAPRTRPRGGRHPGPAARPSRPPPRRARCAAG